LIFGEAKMIDLSVLTTIGAIVFIVVFFIYSKIQLAKQHEKIKKINEEKYRETLRLAEERHKECISKLDEILRRLEK
jgi:hypothetical protein